MSNNRERILFYWKREKEKMLFKTLKYYTFQQNKLTLSCSKTFINSL